MATEDSHHFDEPFLLIVCTDRIFTRCRVPSDTPEFPAYSQVLLRLAALNLRTVIVTAAVYWGFDQELAPHHLTFQHRAGVTPYTSTFVLAECCVFNKQSQPPILCGLVALRVFLPSRY